MTTPKRNIHLTPDATRGLPAKPEPKTVTLKVAAHQAAHAVFAALLGIDFRSVTTEGMHRYDEWPLWAVPSSPAFIDDRARQHVAREMCVAVAGLLAESIYDLGFRWSAQNQNDQDYGIEIAWGFFPEYAQRVAWVNRISDITCEILMIPAVERSINDVANHLMQSHSATGDQVRAIARKYLTIPPHAVERYSPDESRWCRVEDARSIANLPPENTSNTTTCEEVLARLTVARTPGPRLVRTAAA